VELSGSPVTAYTRVPQVVLRNFFSRFFCFRFFAQLRCEMRLREYEANQGKRIGTPARHFGGAGSLARSPLLMLLRSACRFTLRIDFSAVSWAGAFCPPWCHVF
jgi:hypothetical protein